MIVVPISNLLQNLDNIIWTVSFSGGGPIHAHPQFSSRFVIFHRKDVNHIIDNYQIDHIL